MVLYDIPVSKEEFVASAIQSSGQVIFSNLDPNCGYDIYYDSPDSEVNNLSIPKWTVINKIITDNKMTLKYTISGGIDGSSRFYLKKLEHY